MEPGAPGARVKWSAIDVGLTKHAAEPLSRPSDQWQPVAEETRLRYQASMLEGLQEYKQQHPRQP